MCKVYNSIKYRLPTKRAKQVLCPFFYIFVPNLPTVLRLTRHTNFSELKSANNSTKKPDIELFREYEAFVQVLQRALVASKESEKKQPGNKRKNG